MSNNEGQVERIIAEACQTFATGPIPDDARRAAGAVILDWLGCALLGAETPLADAMVKAHEGEIGQGTATCFVGPSVCSPNLAALINGTVSHALELDDIYSPAFYHPGVCVISAALAASQIAGASGDRFVRAVIAGYELSNRVGLGAQPEHYNFWHTTGTIGTIGAAIAASVALGLDARRTAYAVGHATTMAAGLQQAFRSDGMTKPLHAGHAAQSGLIAARLASADFVGSTNMITGPVGFIAAMSHGRDITSHFDDLFKVWTVGRATFKRFSSCGHTFAAVDALDDMIKEAPIAPEDVESIEVGGYQATVDIGAIPNPASPFEARFSTQFCLAAMLLGHDLMNPVTFDTKYNDPAILALLKKVKVSLDPEISAAAPKLRGARLSIKFKDGKERGLFMKTRRGDPDNPVTPADLQDKFMRLVGASKHADRAAALVQWVRELPALAKLSASSLPLGDSEKRRAG